MTPEKAIEIIWERHMDCEDYRLQFDSYPDGYDFELDQAILMAAQALQEIQKYRAIGTVKECRDAVKKLPAAEKAISKLLCDKADWSPCKFCIHDEDEDAVCWDLRNDYESRSSWCCENAKWNGKSE